MKKPLLSLASLASAAAHYVRAMTAMLISWLLHPLELDQVARVCKHIPPLSLSRVAVRSLCSELRLVEYRQ